MDQMLKKSPHNIHIITINITANFNPTELQVQTIELAKTRISIN